MELKIAWLHVWVHEGSFPFVYFFLATSLWSVMIICTGGPRAFSSHDKDKTVRPGVLAVVVCTLGMPTRPSLHPNTSTSGLSLGTTSQHQTHTTQRTPSWRVHIVNKEETITKTKILVWWLLPQWSNLQGCKKIINKPNYCTMCTYKLEKSYVANVVFVNVTMTLISTNEAFVLQLCY